MLGPYETTIASRRRPSTKRDMSQAITTAPAKSTAVATAYRGTASDAQGVGVRWTPVGLNQPGGHVEGVGDEAAEDEDSVDRMRANGAATEGERASQRTRRERRAGGSRGGDRCHLQEPRLDGCAGPHEPSAIAPRRTSAGSSQLSRFAQRRVRCGAGRRSVALGNRRITMRYVSAGGELGEDADSRTPGIGVERLGCRHRRPDEWCQDEYQLTTRIQVLHFECSCDK